MSKVGSVFLSAKALGGVAMISKIGEPTITYTAPFDRCDHEADYATAWAVFEQRGVEADRFFRNP